MPDFEPFPIADYLPGLDLAKEPWIAPRKAWRVLENGYVFRGRVVKRQGYELLSRLQTVESEDASGSHIAGQYDFTVGSLPVLPKEASPSTYAVTITDSTGGTPQVITDDGLGALVGDIDGGGTNTIDYATGQCQFKFAGAAVEPVTIKYEHVRATSTGSSPHDVNPPLGLENFSPIAGGSFLFAWDRHRIFKWDTVQQRFVDQYEVDVWDGEDEDFIWTEVIDDKLLITNGSDILLYSDGSTLLEVQTDTTNPSHTPPDPLTGTGGTPGYSRTITWAKLAFFYKERLVLLHTKEGATQHPTRARWTKVNPDLSDGGTWDTANGAGFADAPTHDFLISALFLGDHLVCWFEQSVWKLVFQDDFRQPFRWERVAETSGSLAKMASVDFSDEIATIGNTEFVATDGIEVSAIDGQIPDFILTTNPDAPQYSFGVVIDEERQVLWSVVDLEEDFPSKVVAYQYDDEAFAFFDWGFHAYGYSERDTEPTWHEMGGGAAGTIKWNEIHAKPDDKSLQAGFPTVIAGERITNKIYTLFSSHQDDGSEFPFRARTGRLNPFLDANSPAQHRARLGHLIIQCDGNPSVNLTVRLYTDFSTVPWKEVTFALTPNTNQGKVRKKIAANRVANFHQIELEVSAGPFELDAVIPYFQPSGRVRTI